MTEPDRDQVEQLERENRALRRANAKLMRERLGSSNTAAAGRLAGSGRRPGSPLRSSGSRLLAPLRKLRVAVRRVLLRVLR